MILGDRAAWIHHKWIFVSTNSRAFRNGSEHFLESGILWLAHRRDKIRIRYVILSEFGCERLIRFNIIIIFIIASYFAVDYASAINVRKRKRCHDWFIWQVLRLLFICTRNRVKSCRVVSRACVYDKHSYLQELILSWQVTSTGVCLDLRDVYRQSVWNWPVAKICTSTLFPGSCLLSTGEKCVSYVGNGVLSRGKSGGRMMLNIDLRKVLKLSGGMRLPSKMPL